MTKYRIIHEACSESEIFHIEWRNAWTIWFCWYRWPTSYSSLAATRQEVLRAKAADVPCKVTIIPA